LVGVEGEGGKCDVSGVIIVIASPLYMYIKLNCNATDILNIGSETELSDKTSKQESLASRDPGASRSQSRSVSSCAGTASHCHENGVAPRGDERRASGPLAREV